jgi:hypothetical protein
MRKLILFAALLVLVGSGVVFAFNFYVAGAPYGIAKGFIPPDAPNGPVGRCERKIARNAGKLAACILKCNGNAALLQVKQISPDALQSCHDGCDAAFKRANGTMAGCVPCVDQDLIAQHFETFLGKRNRDYYCATNGGSPSGAFLDANPQY